MRSTVDGTRVAATRGSDVPSGVFPVRVHSVFRAAVNLRPPEGDLLTLLSAEADDMPRGVRLGSMEDFSSLGLVVGDMGVFAVDAIVLRPSGGLSAFRVDCAAARRIDSQSPPTLGGDRSRWGAGIALLDALQKRAATDLRVAPLLLAAKPSGAMGERLTQAALDLGRSVKARRLDAMRGAAARLVGLGPGLTPAGDDFLCGFMYAGRCRAVARASRSRLLARFDKAVGGLLGRTTDISAAMLRGALAGRVSCALTALAEACAGVAGSDLEGAILRLAAVGHSSGLDAATGFFYGATIWGVEDRRTRRRARLQQQRSPIVSSWRPLEDEDE